MIQNFNEDIRERFGKLYLNGDFVIDKTGDKVVEILNASFVVSDDHLFGEPNEDYIGRELEWYEGQSRNVFDIPGVTPVIWIKCADSDGRINSNYGWCIYSEENGSQFENAVQGLIKNPLSRRAEMIYTRPSMHEDYNAGGMSDFICTEAVQYFIRKGKLDIVVKMRSNDAVFGFLNDLAWQVHVRDKVLNRLKESGMEVESGEVYWNAGSLHVYRRHFNMIEDYLGDKAE